MEKVLKWTMLAQPMCASPVGLWDGPGIWICHMYLCVILTLVAWGAHLRNIVPQLSISRLDFHFNYICKSSYYLIFMLANLETG